MKKVLYLICCLLISVTAFCQNYYWYNGKKIFLPEGNMYYVVFNASDSAEMSSAQFIDKGVLTYGDDKIEKMWGIIRQEDYSKSSKFLYRSKSLLVNDTTNIYVTQRFYVKLKEPEDVSILATLASQYNAQIEKEGEVYLWYVLKCEDHAEKNALELSNIFAESGLFNAAEPEFINIIHPLCVNDTYFDEQWNLENTGQQGLLYEDIDINYCEAHSITKGDASVLIAVLDEGVQLSHPDINIYPSSFDVDNPFGPSVIHSPHGTACAGIISAKTNNHLGVAGVAPQCPVMSISFSTLSTPVDNIAKGFRIARENNVSIINCSWAVYTASDYLQNAIDSAIMYGRNGKGCVITFAAGNSGNGIIDYPACYNPDIIVVGAMTPRGKRKLRTNDPFGEDYWGSSYGSRLDIMAPGIRIPTTDITGNGGYSGASDTLDYYMRFGGTSGACPHVSAIAGLILSVNPYLTQKEVADIIESTAQKVGGYYYSTNPDHPNGTWNIEMGYGLVDAYAAVQEAKNRYPIQGPERMCDTAKYYLKRPLQIGETVQWSIDNGQNYNPWYSIIGPNNQDTVTIACDEVRFRPLRDDESDNATDSRLIDDPFTPPINNTKLLSATISTGSTSETYTKRLHHHIYIVPIATASETSTTWPLQTQRTFNVTNCELIPDSLIQWTLKRISRPFAQSHNTVVQTSYYYGKTLTVGASFGTFFPGDSLIIYATNFYGECGPHKSNVFRFKVILPQLSLLSENVDNELLNIFIVEENEESQYVPAQLNTEKRYTLELWHNIYGSLCTIPVLSATTQMNIAGLPSGVCVLLLKENGEVVAQTKVLIQ